MKIFFALSNFELTSRKSTQKSNTDQENLPFQIKRKQKWTSKDTHHKASTFIDLEMPKRRKN